jgi:hypothetical protein
LYGATPQEERMSFKAREIMTDVLLARAFQPAAPGFALCTEVTRPPDEDDVECEVTRPPSEPPSRLEDLAVLRLQLLQAMSAGPA